MRSKDKTLMAAIEKFVSDYTDSNGISPTMQEVADGVGSSKAKIFSPFDAMKGLQEALRDREERHLRVDRHDISEEQAEHNSRIFLKLRRGMKVEIDCYCAFHDVTKRGRITDVSSTFRWLKLDGEQIYFEDIYSIEITDLG